MLANEESIVATLCSVGMRIVLSRHCLYWLEKRCWHAILASCEEIMVETLPILAWGNYYGETAGQVLACKTFLIHVLGKYCGDTAEVGILA